MKKFILLLLLVSVHGFAQTIDYNTKKGFVANGYDVVAYFNNEAIKGSKKITTEYDGVKFKFSSNKYFKSVFSHVYSGIVKPVFGL